MRLIVTMSSLLALVAALLVCVEAAATDLNVNHADKVSVDRGSLLDSGEYSDLTLVLNLPLEPDVANLNDPSDQNTETLFKVHKSVLVPNCPFFKSALFILTNLSEKLKTK